MGFTIRRVPPDWQHPRNEDGTFAQLLPQSEVGACNTLSEWRGIEEHDIYMPKWSTKQASSFCLYEEYDCGAPVSPVFNSYVDIAQWLTVNGPAVFKGLDDKEVFERWVCMAYGGFLNFNVVGPADVIHADSGAPGIW